jgi:hypothetical protein
MRRVRNAAAVVLAATALLRPLGAQAISQGFEMERLGRAAEAAQIYLTTLGTEPANLSALLGLERVLPRLNRLVELVPLMQHARSLDPGNAILRGLELRTYSGLSELDSLDAAARRWVQESPRDEAAYREWLLALQDTRQFDAARGVITRAREAIGATVLAIEAAELEQRLGNYEGAAREWGLAVAGAPGMLPNAAGQLESVPDTAREAVVQTLSGPAASIPARRLAAELLLGWGQAMRGWALIESTIAPPTPPAEAAAALRRFADLALLSAPEIRRARGLALARYAEYVPAPMASRIRGEAARALLDGGDGPAARIVLEQLASDSGAPSSARALAQGTLVRLLIEEGKLDQAAARLTELDDDLAGDERIALRLALARAQVRRGALDLADSTLAADSSVEALALRGWVALYRGDVKDAVERFRAAGPYAGDRRDATERTAMLALLQGIREARAPALGAALLLLAKGDSAAALPALQRVAEAATGTARADLLLLGGRVAARLGGAHDSTAARLFARAADPGAGAPGAAAPAAELEWARLLLRQQRTAEAVARLEHLILTYPGSAVVPEARRELERVKGAIPRS